MASTYSSNLKIELIATGEQSGVWGTTTNNNFTNVFEQAIVGRGTANFPADADLTLTFTDTVGSQTARNVYLNATSGVSLTQTRNLIVPTINKNYVVQNNTTGSQSIIVKTSAGTGITIPNGFSCAVYVDGTNVIQASNYFPVVTATQVNITGQGDLRLEDTTGGEYVAIQAPGTLASSYTLTLPVDDGTNGQALITDGSGNLSWSTAASGDVYGPASATDNAIARFDGTTGKLIQNSVVTIADTTGDMAGIGNLTINGTTVTIPNGLNFDSDTLVIDAANNRVGIGTNSPTSKLDVFGSGLLYSFLRNSTVTTLMAVDTSAAYFGSGTNHPVVFQTNNTERMRIDSSGNVGIGTTNPTSKLTVVGTLETSAFQVSLSSNQTTIDSYNYNMLLSSVFNGGIGGNIIFNTGVTTVSERMRIDSSGNVGIGTSSPTISGNAFTILNVKGVSNNVGLITVTSNDLGSSVQLYSGNSSSDNPAIAYQRNLRFGTATDTGVGGFTERMRIDSSGNVGIGVTPSAWDSSVAKTLQVGNGSTPLGLFSYNNGIVGLNNNAYFNSGDKYATTNYASRYYQYNGSHTWETAPSGTAGNAITFTQAMTLDASGNLGIGTSSPADSLGYGRALDIQGVNGSALYLRGSTNPSTVYGLIAYDNVTGRTNIAAIGASNYLRFISGGNETMRLDSSGNLGLGVTPSAWVNSATRKAIQFPAVGQVAASGTMVLYSNSYYNGTNDIYTTTGAAGVYTIAGNVHSWGQQVSGTAGATLNFSTAMTLDASGNLGIGTSSPDNVLHLNRSSGDVFTKFVSGSTTSVIGTNGSNQLDIRMVSNQPMLFSTNNSERMRITSGGDLLVGTTTAGARVVVSAATASSGGILIQQPNSATGTSLVSQSVSTAGTGWYHFVGQTGNGTSVTTNNIFIYGNGNIENTNNSYGSISDAKIKENIVDATPKLSDLMKVKVRNYNLKGDYNQHKQIGVVAQELESVFPSLVEETADRDEKGNDLGTTTKSVKYSVFVPMLIKAMQEQQAMIVAMQKEIAELKAK